MDERAFDVRYRPWARPSGELFSEASRYIPGVTRQQAAAEPVSPTLAPAAGADPAS